MKNKLKTKDIITVILLSLCNIIVFSLGTFMYVTPITIILTPVLYALLQGVAFYVIGVKVKKPNAYLIYSIIQGIIGFYIPYIALYIVSGLIGELILRKKGYGNLKAIGIFYVIQQVFACIGSTIYPLAIAFVNTTSKISEKEMLLKVTKVEELLASWGAPALLILVTLTASIGAYIGKRIVEKHILAKDTTIKKDDYAKNKSNQPSFFKEMSVFIKPYKSRLVLSVIISLFSVLSELLSYVAVGMLIGELLNGANDITKISLMLLLAIASKLTNVLFLNISSSISHKAAYYILRDLRLGLSNKMKKLPLGFFETNTSGRLKVMFVDRVEEIEKILAHLLPEMTSNLCIPLCLMIWTFFIDWRMSLCMILWIVIGLSLSSGMMYKYDERFQKQIEIQKSMNLAVVEYVSGIEVIKTFNQSLNPYHKFKNAVENHARYAINWMKQTQIFASLCYSVAPISVFGVLIFGLIFYGKGTLLATDLILFVIISMGIFNPIAKASSYFDQLAQMGTVARELNEIFEYPELARNQTSNISRLKNLNIKFEDVEFSYNKIKKTIKNINLEIKEQSMVALIGPSGSGKSTIAKLLAGYWDADKGNILIGETPISYLSQQDMNSLISYVDQDAFLFNMSIMENIRLGKTEATDKEVMNAAKRAGCYDVIVSLPQGFNTQVGDFGKKLSGGERQKICIAREMLKDTPIMILDEPTSSSDPYSEREIQKALVEATKGKTLIVIAHRLSTIINADKLVYLENGEIQSSGTHKELLKMNENYRKSWQLMDEGRKELVC